MISWNLLWAGIINEFSGLGLTERVWVTEVPPGGCFNRIALREVKGKTIDYPYPVLILPGMTSHGEQLIHVSWRGIQPIEPSIPDSMIPIYLAKNGFLVYTIDYRTHFVTPDTKDFSFMIDWGWDAWLSDIKESIAKIKEITGKDKVILMGESFGGIASMNYLVTHPEDVKAVVLLDGAPIKMQPFHALPIKTVDEIRTIRLYAIPSALAGAQYSGGVNNVIWLKALYNPSLPSPDPRFKTLSEHLMDTLYNQGMVNPYSYPNTPYQVAFAIMATFDPYWPTRLVIEPIDAFRDKYVEIKVPILAVISELLGVKLFDADLVRRLTGDIMILNGYGHLDVYANPNNVKDVNEPVLSWLRKIR